MKNMGLKSLDFKTLGVLKSRLLRLKKQFFLNNFFRASFDFALSRMVKVWDHARFDDRKIGASTPLYL